VPPSKKGRKTPKKGVQRGLGVEVLDALKGRFGEKRGFLSPTGGWTVIGLGL